MKDRIGLEDRTRFYAPEQVSDLLDLSFKAVISLYQGTRSRISSFLLHLGCEVIVHRSSYFYAFPGIPRTITFPVNGSCTQDDGL